MGFYSCNEECLKQTKYKTSKRAYWSIKGNECKYCGTCERAFYDCDDICCLCCGRKLRFYFKSSTIRDTLRNTLSKSMTKRGRFTPRYYGV